MSKLYGDIRSDRRQNPVTLQGDSWISATFKFGSKDDSKDAVRIEIGSDPFSASVWVRPELRPKDRGIRLLFSQTGCLYADIFTQNGDIFDLDTFTDAQDTFENFSGLMSKLADELGLYYDRTALDEWLKEQ